MEEGVKVSVVIICNGRDLLVETCLYAVSAATYGMEAELFVIDNNSPDRAADYLAPLFPDVVFIRKEETFPDVELHREMLRKMAGEYILLLDARVIIGEDLIRTMCYFMDEHSEIGAVGPKVLDIHGAFVPESKRAFPSATTAFYKKTGLSFLFPASSRFNRYYLPHLSMDMKHRVEMVSSSFMMLSRVAIEKVGWPAPGEMKYEEDVEIAFRLAKGGFKCYYLPERVVHCGKGTGLESSMRRRLLVVAREENFKETKAACLSYFSGWEYVNLWNLNEERVLGAINRNNQMKGFTDIAVCYPDVRFEQVLLLMDKMENKRIAYHIYNQKNRVLVSPGK